MTNQAKLLIKEHEWYITPSDYYSRVYLQAHKVDPGNQEFLQELSRFFYHQMVYNEDYVEDAFKDPEKWPSDIPHDQIADRLGFYEQLYQEYIPGYSPMEKAVNTIKILEKQQNKDKKKRKESDSLSETFTRVKGNLPDKETFECTTWNKLLNERGLEEFDKKIDHLNKVAIVEGFGKSFEIKKTTEIKRVPTSQKVKTVRLSEYSDIVRSPLYQRMFPNYTIKLLNKDLMVNVPIRSEESKQKIIILLDFSGSMCDPVKQEWVLAILSDRLHYAMKEECEIFFSYFLEDLYIPHDEKARGQKGYFMHVYNEETARKFFREFNICPSGGDTAVGRIINKIKNEVEDNQRLFNLNVDLSVQKPEILVINDGQDSVKVDNLQWKTNAITLCGRNEELKNLCEKTGGKYISIMADGTIDQ